MTELTRGVREGIVVTLRAGDKCERRRLCRRNKFMRSTLFFSLSYSIAADRDENIYPRSFLHPFLHMKPKSHHLSLHVPHLPPPASLLLEQDITDEEHRRPLRSDQKIREPQRHENIPEPHTHRHIPPARELVPTQTHTDIRNVEHWRETKGSREDWQLSRSQSISRRHVAGAATFPPQPVGTCEVHEQLLPDSFRQHLTVAMLSTWQN
ncbi:hypothetical protein F2P81_019012 [Scophthalmus maximus]|uniref:Uncharacterized protein n=1 Tax=Scophthalmus maximus TaxID=52904 RepID=A0A6A4S9Q9_SCOMX|nr:hypothetical protein F2P81_019012 [Scophthalmus maximus]